MTGTLIEDARKYWLNTINLNPDAGILTTLKTFMEDRYEILTESELDTLAFEILTTSKL